MGSAGLFHPSEFKVERVSYDVITPSATRAVFEAIFWKPAIRWQVTKIEVLNPIRWTTIRRNEVAAVSNSPIFIEEKRQQKNSLILRDVRYRIHAKLVFIPKRDRGNSDSKNPIIDREESDLLRTDENQEVQRDVSTSRRQGQCFTQPYLGCREFSASFRLVDPATEALISPILIARILA